MSTSRELESEPGSQPSVANHTKMHRFSPGLRTISGALVLLIIVQFVLYRHYFFKYVAPFYPINYDQLGTYLTVYKTYYSLHAGGWNHIAQAFDSGARIEGMKGALLPVMGLLSAYLFGPTRFAIGAVNFWIFAAAETTVFVYCFKRKGLLAGILTLGLFYFADIHLASVGGIFDFRRDYLGVLLMGATFISVCEWLKTGSRTALILLCSLLLASTLGRFITMFYWIGCGLIITTALGLSYFFKSASRADCLVLLKRTLVVVAAAAVGFIVHLCLFAETFRRYYVLLKVHDEDTMRWIEFGVHNGWERLAYYPNSLFNHFGVMICLSLIVSVVAIGCALASQKKVAVKFDREQTILLTVFASLSLAVYLILTAYSPSPVVVSCLAIPLTLVLGTMIISLFELQSRRVSIALAALVFIAGNYVFIDELMHARARPHASFADAQNCNMLIGEAIGLVDKRGDKPTVVCFPIVHDGVNQLTFQLTWYETMRRQVPLTLKFRAVKPFPAITWPELADKIKVSHIAVAPLSIATPAPGTFEYPGLVAIRSNLPKLAQALSSFKRLSAHDLYSGAWRAAVYYRDAADLESAKVMAAPSDYELSDK